MNDGNGIRDSVRARYAAAATHAAAGQHEQAFGVEESCCGGAPVTTTDPQGRVVFGADLYDASAIDGADRALAASLGCGVPTAVADLHPGETVLDLGSGAGADVLISARRCTRRACDRPRHDSGDARPRPTQCR